MNDLVRYGGMAVIGVLAYQAFKRYQAQQGAGEQKAAGTDARPQWCRRPTVAFIPLRRPAAPMPSPACCQGNGRRDAGRRCHRRR